MKNQIITAALAIALLSGTSALAQDDHHDRPDSGQSHEHGSPAAGGGPQGQGRGGQGQGQPQGQGRAPTQVQGQSQGQGQQGGRGAGGYTGQQQGQGQQGGRGAGSYTGQQQGQGQQGGRGVGSYTGQQQGQAQQGGRGAGGYSGQGQQQGQGQQGGRDYRSGQQGDYRGQQGGNFGGGHAQPLDQHRYPSQIRAQQRFRWQGQWSRPNGYYYRRWSYGEFLPFGWFAEQFWIDNYDYYGLPPAPYGYAWVREGGDALLVDIYSGQVVEVEYGLFY